MEGFLTTKEMFQTQRLLHGNGRLLYKYTPFSSSSQEPKYSNGVLANADHYFRGKAFE